MRFTNGDWTVTIEEFKTTLARLPAREAVGVPYEIFEQLFPPGVEDDGVIGRACDLASSRGCIIVHRAENRDVLFIKSA
jgi:hypothetical protein